MVQMNKISNCNIIFVVMFIYLIWMEVALYIKLQQLPSLADRLSMEKKDGPFSPFEPITIKLLMSPPNMHFINLPLAVWLEDTIHISYYFTPNFISFTGLFFGLCAAKLVMCQSYRFRLLGYVAFALRDFMDGLDGVVARERAHLGNRQMMNPESWGFAIDGICDGVADVAVILAFGIYLLKSMSITDQNKDGYDRLTDVEQANIDHDLKKEKKKEHSNRSISRFWSWFKSLKMQWFMPVLTKVVLFAILFGSCSGIWNYFMYNYSILMDSELIVQTERQQLIQSMIYKSPIMWLVIFLWRWINAVSMMFIFMITVVFEKTDEYLNFVKSHGILILTTVTTITYIHYTYALAQISEI